MAIQCPKCGRQYDVTLFQFGNKVLCDCGELIDRQDPMTIKMKDMPAQIEKEKIEKEKIEHFQRMADRVSFLIVASDYPEVDIEIEKSKVRRVCEELFPDKLWLYELIYEARFKRLWEQFRWSGKI